ncbi:hypothetical protein BO78DRAFT_429698 [Aspergillus sclerotiicarbonarius CBS 121057]|uniref:Zn(2)-C6 fungal-type domain-containing protein n=1 Tax=Aspergillus sclerotiicarbonarius (strain CBS 121057 / IBT 28362) TaxID=1448318 RepID=A0A319EFF8_ASPSB|nr:hypothetical protein BO78DRAFT_429698 [Aspergillus sclerotiicarbonarius CBS 121057]
MTPQPTSKDYPVCRECRIRKIRCGRERPQCANCIRFGHNCEWTGQGKKPNQTALLSSQINDLRNQVERLDDAIAEIQASMGIFHAISSHDPRPKLPCTSCMGSLAEANYLDRGGNAPRSTQEEGSPVFCSPYSNAKASYLDPVCPMFNFSASKQGFHSTHDPGTNPQSPDVSHKVLSNIFPELIKPHQATIRRERIPILAESATHSPGLPVAKPNYQSGAYRQEDQLVSGPTAWGDSPGIAGHPMYRDLVNPFFSPPS